MPSNPGPRTFEASAAGAMQLFHEDNYAIHDFYERDEVPVFSTRYDFQQQLDKYLNDPDLLLETAKKAQARTLRDHLYNNRIQTVMEILKNDGFLD